MCKPKTNNEEALQSSFYTKLPARDIADIFRFVNQQCRFLSALTPLQPRYAKKIADEDSMTAVIIAQAMNLNMAETSDIPYHSLEATYQQYLRLSRALPICRLSSSTSSAATILRNTRIA